MIELVNYEINATANLVKLYMSRFTFVLDFRPSYDSVELWLTKKSKYIYIFFLNKKSQNILCKYI